MTTLNFRNIFWKYFCYWYNAIFLELPEDFAPMCLVFKYSQTQILLLDCANCKKEIIKISCLDFVCYQFRVLFYKI